MSKLLDYMNQLDRDANLRTASQKDPAVAMKNFGLSADECEIMLQGDVKRVAEFIGIRKVEFSSILHPQSAPISIGVRANA